MKRNRRHPKKTKETTSSSARRRPGKAGAAQSEVWEAPYDGTTLPLEKPATRGGRWKCFRTTSGQHPAACSGRKGKKWDLKYLFFFFKFYHFTATNPSPSTLMHTCSVM